MHHSGSRIRDKKIHTQSNVFIGKEITNENGIACVWFFLHSN
jgi:hypothetical protein